MKDEFPFNPAVLLALHQRLARGDRTASEELARLVLQSLVERVRSSDRDMAWDAVIDAWTDYASRPEQYDPAHGVPLDRFLLMAARRNLSNLKTSDVRRRDRERRVAESTTKNSVELDPAVRNLHTVEETAARRSERARLMAALPDEADRKLLALRLDGERRTPRFAAILGIAHLPIAEQRVLVKRAKDRVDKALRRLKEH